MTRINLFGWLVLGVAISAMGALQVGCCGGSSSASEDWLTEAAEAAAASTASDGQVKTCNDTVSISQCSEHQGQAFAILGEDFYKGICELTDGSWGTDPCPTGDIVGRCDDGDGSVTIYYSTGGSPYTAATAKEGCDFTEGSFKS
jgi:hypothetical protein